MTRLEWEEAMDAIDKQLEGGGFTINLMLYGGAILRDYAVHELSVSGLIELAKPDCPPIFVAVAAVMAVELDAKESGL